MSVQSYLENLASKLVLSSDEKTKINTSLTTLSRKFDSHFQQRLDDHFNFGSSTRGTILPRKADKNSDIDYMIIFHNTESYKPQTLLNHLRGFVEAAYSRSEIKQSHPTIVLELQHIKFELVPAVKNIWGSIHIPSPASSFTEWIPTDPNGFNAVITDKNKNNGNNIKPLVRLMKYWNAQNGYYLPSFLLEKWITETYYYWCNNLKDYVYKTFESLNYNYSDPQTYKNNVDRAKQIITNAKYYESKGLLVNAEDEIKKLLPDI